MKPCRNGVMIGFWLGVLTVPGHLYPQGAPREGGRDLPARRPTLPRVPERLDAVTVWEASLDICRDNETKANEHADLVEAVIHDGTELWMYTTGHSSSGCSRSVTA